MSPAAAPAPGAASHPAAAPPAPAFPRLEDLLARAPGENFPVALRVLPAAVRRDLMAIYGFARLADQLGDDAPGDRVAALDALERELEDAFRGEARHPVLVRLQPVLARRRLPREPFLRLIEANRADQRVCRQASWEALLGYCRLSANPVGRLVLALFRADTPDRVADSDAVCTALQVLEHCQDVREDRQAGRTYLPAEDLARLGVAEGDLLARPAPAALRAVVRLQVERSRALLGRAFPLVASLRGAARLAVAGFVAGGLATADALERADFDPSAGAPRPRRRDVARYAARLLLARRRP